MNKILFISIFILNGEIKSQLLYNLIPKYKTYKEQGEIYNLIAEKDYFYVMGYIPELDSSINRYKAIPYVAQFDYSGSINYFNKITGDSIDQIGLINKPVYLNRNGNYYTWFYGYTNSTDCRYSRYLCELDPRTGKIVKGKSLCHPNLESNEEYGHYTFFFDDVNKITISSYYWSKSRLYFQISELDTNFQLVRKFNLPDFYFALNSRAINIENGSIELSGEGQLLDNNYKTIDDTSRLFYLRCDTSGNVLHFNYLKITKHLGTFLQNVNTYRRADNKDWVIGPQELLTSSSNPLYERTIPFILRMSSQFDTLRWITRFLELPIQLDYLNEFWSLETAFNDSGFIGIGNIRPHYPNEITPYGLVFKVSDSGDSLWTRKILPIGLTHGRILLSDLLGIKKTPFNTYLIAGHFIDSIGYVTKPWILQLDSFGCVIPGCQNSLNTKESPSSMAQSFRLYPSSVNDKLSLLSYLNSEEDCFLKFYDQNGKIKYQIKIKFEQAVQYIFDVSEYEPGLYLIKIMDKRGSINWSGKFIKLNYK